MKSNMIHVTHKTNNTQRGREGERQRTDVDGRLATHDLRRQGRKLGDILFPRTERETKTNVCDPLEK